MAEHNAPYEAMLLWAWLGYYEREQKWWLKYKGIACPSLPRPAGRLRSRGKRGKVLRTLVITSARRSAGLTRLTTISFQIRTYSPYRRDELYLMHPLYCLLVNAAPPDAFARHSFRATFHNTNHNADEGPRTPICVGTGRGNKSDQCIWA